MTVARSRLPLLAWPVGLLTLLLTAASLRVLHPHGLILDAVAALLLAIGYAKLAITTVTACLGLAAAPPLAAQALAQDAPRGRTALLVPIFNEALPPIRAALAAMAGELTPEDDVTIFVLSDTQDARMAAAEAHAFPPHDLAPSGVEIRYRRRTANTGRKAGNIADFCEGDGRAYDFAIILDADSLMTGAAIRQLIAAIAGDARAGLVQSVPYPAGGLTLFGRMQQFGARLHTPLAVGGQDLWQGRRGTFWGHNAIVRLAAFRAHATLPVLRGRPPLGGEILCHDTIEAALLLEAGWEVRIVREIAGSWETTPSNLVDHLAREQRWCQGNLQHLRLVARRGLLAESRLHIANGILHYLAAPAGLLLSALLLGASRWFGAFDGHAPRGAIPIAIGLGALTLFGPRPLDVARALLSPAASRSHGGRMALLASAMGEQVAGLLTAPVFMLSVAGFVAATFAGRVVRWDPPARGDRAVGWREAWSRFRGHTLLGAGLLLACVWWRPAALPWVALATTGLVLSVPMTVASGSLALGALARRCGLFLTEDELAPPATLAAFGRLPPVGSVSPAPLAGRPAEGLPVVPWAARPVRAAVGGELR